LNDYAFDQLLKELEELEKEFPEYASELSPLIGIIWCI